MSGEIKVDIMESWTVFNVLEKKKDFSRFGGEMEQIF